MKLVDRWSEAFNIHTAYVYVYVNINAEHKNS